jgi:hypothetical protein
LDPISIIIEIEIATLVLAGVGAFATWTHQKNQERAHRQRERQHQEMKALHERHHAERMQATAGETDKSAKPVQRTKAL